MAIEIHNVIAPDGRLLKKAIIGDDICAIEFLDDKRDWHVSLNDDKEHEGYSSDAAIVVKQPDCAYKCSVEEANRVIKELSEKAEKKARAVTHKSPEGEGGRKC